MPPESDSSGVFENIKIFSYEKRQFQSYGKKLGEIDRKKAQTLIDMGLYCKELSYMIQNDVKLEQEIIGWNL